MICGVALLWRKILSFLSLQMDQQVSAKRELIPRRTSPVECAMTWSQASEDDAAPAAWLILRQRGQAESKLQILQAKWHSKKRCVAVSRLRTQSPTPPLQAVGAPQTILVEEP